MQAVVLTAIASGLIWYVHLATPCTPWSKARTTSRKPPNMAVVWFTKKVLEAARKHNVYWSLENPYGSGLFDFPPIAAELRKFRLQPAPGGGSAAHAQAPAPGGGSAGHVQVLDSGAMQVRYECCAWGATFQKKKRVSDELPASAGVGEEVPGTPCPKNLTLQQLC